MDLSAAAEAVGGAIAVPREGRWRGGGNGAVAGAEAGAAVVVRVLGYAVHG